MSTIVDETSLENPITLEQLGDESHIYSSETLVPALLSILPVNAAGIDS